MYEHCSPKISSILFCSSFFFNQSYLGSSNHLSRGKKFTGTATRLSILPCQYCRESCVVKRIVARNCLNWSVFCRSLEGLSHLVDKYLPESDNTVDGGNSITVSYSKISLKINAHKQGSFKVAREGRLVCLSAGSFSCSILKLLSTRQILQGNSLSSRP